MIPLIFMLLSLASTGACVAVAVIFFLALLFIVSVNVAQARRPNMLPATLQTWDFLPKCMTSLETIDRAICGPLGKMCPCCKSAAVAPQHTKTTADQMEGGVKPTGKPEA